MKYRLRFGFLLIAAAVAFPERSPAPVVFKLGEGVKYSAPGEEEVSGTAQEMTTAAEAAAQRGDTKRAAKIYSKLLRRYPHYHLAPQASYRIGEIQETAS